MQKENIQQAGQAARRLAEELAETVRSSSVPEAHWEEVLEQLRMLVVDEEKESSE